MDGLARKLEGIYLHMCSEAIALNLCIASFTEPYILHEYIVKENLNAYINKTNAHKREYIQRVKKREKAFMKQVTALGELIEALKREEEKQTINKIIDRV